MFEFVLKGNYFKHVLIFQDAATIFVSNYLIACYSLINIMICYYLHFLKCKLLTNLKVKILQSNKYKYVFFLGLILRVLWHNVIE